MKPKLTKPEITTCESLPHDPVMTKPQEEKEAPAKDSSEWSDELAELLYAYKCGETDSNHNLYKFVLRVSQESKRQGVEEVITMLTTDITDIEFEEGGKKLWEVLPNVGVEPCIECENGMKIRKLITDKKL